MKAIKFIFSAVLIIMSQFAFAQTGQWNLAGNVLNGAQKLGSTNNAALNFITNNKTRISLTVAGNLDISSDQSSIQFALPGTNPQPMMFMFPSGTENRNRMVIAHSPAFTNFGLQYNDQEDRFDFLSAGTSIFNVNLGLSSVGVTGTFKVSGTSTFTGNVTTGGNLGIGTATPRANLHIVRGSAGVSPFFNAPLVVENSTHSYLNLLSPANTESGVLFGNPTSNIDGGIVYNNGVTPKGFQFRTSTNNTRMVLTGKGFLGVGTTAPASELHLVNADIDDGSHGFRIQNALSASQWTFFANSFGELELYHGNVIKGFFDRETGNYISDFILKGKNDVTIQPQEEQAQDVLQKIIKLDIKRSHFTANKSTEKSQYGMIPQEVEKIFPEAVYHKIMDSTNKDLYAINYRAFGVIALKGIQEQQTKVEEQEQANKRQQEKIITLEDRISKLEAAINNGRAGRIGVDNSINKQIRDITLEQNQPNPFNQSTVIRYHVPAGTIGQINLYNGNGILVKTVKVNETGQAVINASDLQPGTYNYTLIVDGKMAASKKLVLIR
jgi:hypothetical protein